MTTQHALTKQRCWTIAMLLLFVSKAAWAGDLSGSLFPAVGWHRGDVSVAQENSRKAILAALRSNVPNIEVDIIDFVDKRRGRIGLLSHDYHMRRINGREGSFSRYSHLEDIPQNRANPGLPPEPYLSVVDLFDLIKEEMQANGIVPVVSLDMKEERTGEAFGRWVGALITTYGFESHVFASSFYKRNVAGVESTCPECMTGGLVFNDHYALKYLNYKYSSLDLTKLSQLTFYAGFWGKKKYDHDFVLIQDDIYFSDPEIIDYWKIQRNVKFVGVFIYNKKQAYTPREVALLQRIDWLELDGLQIGQTCGSL